VAALGKQSTSTNANLQEPAILIELFCFFVYEPHIDLGAHLAPVGFLGGDCLMISPRSAPPEISKRPTSSEPVRSTRLKFSKKRLVVAFVIAAMSDIIGAFATLAPPIGWAVDIVTALLLFMVLGWQWLLLPGLALEAIPGVGVVPLWLLVVGAIAVLGTPRPKIGQH
jgi:hypothetical protein